MMQISRVRERASGLFVLFLIAAVTCLIRLSPVLRHGVAWAMDQDSVGYIALAKGLRAGCGFAAQWSNGRCGPAELERTPGYPLVLSFLPSMRAAIVVNSVLGAGVCLLIALFVWRHWSLAAAIIAESLLAFDLSTIIVSNQIATEVLFTLLTTTAILLVLTSICRNHFDIRVILGMLGAGLLLALGEFVRPIGQVLIIVGAISALALRDITMGRRAALIVLVLSLPVLSILGWSYRNYKLRGIWTFSSIGAINLYYYRAAALIAHDSGRKFDDVQAELLRSAGRLREGADLWSKTYDEDPADLQIRSRKILFQHPYALALMTLKSFIWICYAPPNRPALGELLAHNPDRAETNAFVSRNIVSDIKSTLSSRWLLEMRTLISLQLGLTLFTWTGVGLALRRFRHEPPPQRWVLLILLCAAFVLVAAASGPEGNDRFRVPAMPMLALLAAFGWTTTGRDEFRSVLSRSCG